MPLHLPIAFLGPAELGVMVPLVIFMIPIIAILTSHQRKMAEIIHGRGGENGNAIDPRLGYEIESMRRELAEVKTLLHQQAIAIDNLAPRLPGTSQIPERLENLTR